MYELHCRLESLSSNKQADLSCTVYAPLVCKRSVSDQKLYTQGNKSLNATSVEIDWKVQIFENDLDSVSQNQEMVSGSLEKVSMRLSTAVEVAAVGSYHHRLYRNV